MDDLYAPLPRDEVVKAIERRKPERVPMVYAKWWGEGLEDKYGDKLAPFERYPEDARVLLIEPIEYASMGLSWELPSGGAHDTTSILDDWSKLDEFIHCLPRPEDHALLAEVAHQVVQARLEDRYVLFGWWRLFFERPWGIRGMQNLLTDYYLYPEQVHRLHTALCELYLGYLKWAIKEIQPDGFWTSDDLGHQTQCFMRPTTFREFLKPYYTKIGEMVKDAGIHWWLHSCGNNTALLPDLIEAGVNVFHPVQKGTMDERTVAHDFGDRLTFLAGIDVQHILQEKSPAEVRQEVRFLIDTFDQPGGGLCLAAGNGILPGTPLECIEAFLDEALHYGMLHRQQYT